MKSKNFLLICFFSFSIIISLNAFSQESLICTNPLKAICKDTQKQRSQREAYINALKNTIAAEAEKKALPRIIEMGNKYRSQIYYVKRMIDAYKIRNQEIMKSAKARISGIETVITNPKNILLLKNYMKQAIDESNFNLPIRVYFKSIIDSIIIGNFNDYLERSGLEDSFVLQILDNSCGLDGMVTNAFATFFEKSNIKQRYVLLCPGFLITLSQIPNEEEKLNSILLAIAHEMAHHIDNSVIGGNLYLPYLTCLKKNYISEFNSTVDDMNFCWKKSKNQSECDMKIVSSHARELIADQWGIKVLEIHAKAQGYSNSQMESLLINSFARICDSGDEGIHPTGDFRIEGLLRKNPEVSDYLTCNNSRAKRPSCTFDGAINL